jgi:hypothetical protein
MLVYRKSFLLSSKGLQLFKLGEMVQVLSVLVLLVQKYKY